MNHFLNHFLNYLQTVQSLTYTVFNGMCIRLQLDNIYFFLFFRRAGEVNHPWTGIVRQSTGQWAFVDGSPVEYMPPTAFSNYQGENCSQINYYDPGIFDTPCTGISSFICQFPSSAQSICKYLYILDVVIL